jgi:hypothetical protein
MENLFVFNKWFYIEAHDCAVRSIDSDSLNLTTITCAENGEIRFWPFKNKKTLNSCMEKPKFEMKINENINRTLLHRER